MDISVNKRQIGLNFINGYAEIWLWAPDVAKAIVEIPKVNLKLAMVKKPNGYWHLKTDQITGNQEYRFQLQDEGQVKRLEAHYFHRADPAMIQKSHDDDFSIAFDLNDFKWGDDHWISPALEHYIIYELHCGTFTSEGDFDSIGKKLSYLKDLGITAIEIMPVAQFSGNRNWGYDGVYPFAVQNSYGGAEALQRLVNTCHKMGFSVILDVVYNHVGPEGNYFEDFGPYFTDKYHTPWGKAINFDDAWSDEVRKFYIENALMWFRDFHIDALRLDAVHAIKDFGAVHILEEIKQYTDQLSKMTGKAYYLIAESDLNDNRYINEQKNAGYGMDAQWIDEFHHALRVASGQPKTGYYEDFDGVSDLAKSYQDAYVYDGQYSLHRNKTFGKKALGNPGKQFIVFSQNHDQTGNRMLGERTSNLVSHAMLKLLAGAVFCSPFIPLIFMGEEYGETSPFLFFVSHKSEEIIEAVRKGRRAEFAAFHQNGITPDPQSEETFNKSKLDWGRSQVGNHATLYNYYKSLISLRKKNTVLSDLNRENLEVVTFKDQKAIILKRWNKAETVYCVLNFSAAKQTINYLLPGDCKIILNSASDDSVTKLDAIYKTSQINISPESIIIFSYLHV